ncbi:MAG: non-canonical purine NTP diphosphatase [Lentimicrobium sp.]|nr:non-canonical purine NTP diphosphatase [Lentimicrobium sp.]
MRNELQSIVFASNNKHKLEEVTDILKSRYKVVSLAEIGCFDDIPETSDTLEGNALLKARHVFEKYQMDCFADDTGLEVEALSGRPGVYSARYAGEGCSYEDNVKKLLAEMEGITNRRARFRTVIALIAGNQVRYFEGVINGFISTEKKGSSGFGYDPVFVPEGYNQTFAEMTAGLKNTISHRALAVSNLAKALLDVE